MGIQSELPTLTCIDYQKRIFAAMNYINGNIDREVPLSEIAEIASFSPFHFHRIFKAVVGENVAEFTRRLRIESAAGRLLAYPEQDITSIALSSGFSSSQNFAKAFHLRYETSPTQYRKNRVKQKLPKEMVTVSIREMPLSKVASIRLIGMYPESCTKAFSELLQWAHEKVPPGLGSLLALYWDNPEITPLDKCRFDCCLRVDENIMPSDQIFIQNFGGGMWAFCRFETKAEGIRKAWEDSFQWLVESGYECRPLPCCEIYHNNAQEHPQGKWIYDIAIPLKES